MSILSDLNAPNIFSGSSGSLSSIIIILLMFFFVLVIGRFGFWYYSKKFKKSQFNKQIPIFERSHGKYDRIGIDHAKELFVPDTNISLYYLKDRKIYLARPTRSMGKGEYWYYISENGEWVNFDMSSNPEDDTLAMANYDHRDTRYAYVNLTEIIKRNYKDKSVNWWKEYSGVITIIIVGIMFIGAMWFFFWRTGVLMEQMKPLADAIASSSEKIAEATANLQNINSGVISAG